MIRLRDAALLASTKLRTRRVRQVLAVVGAAMVFAQLAFASMVVAGLDQSLGRYAQSGYGNRLFAQLDYADRDYQRVATRAEELRKADFQRQKDEARRKGLPEPQEGEGHKTMLSSGGFELAAQKELYPRESLEQVRARLSGLPVSGLYESRSLHYGSGVGLRVLAGGREHSQDEAPAGPPMFGGFGMDPLTSPAVSAMSRELLEPFVVPGESIERPKGGPIPMLIPMDAAFKLAGASIPQNATTDEQVRIKREVRQQLAGQNLLMCARNAAAQELLDTAKMQAEEAKRNAGNKSYQRPALQYAVPAGLCQPVAVARDVRTTEEKAFDKQIRAAQGASAPVTELLTFRVVGFVPSLNFTGGNPFTLAAMLQTGPQNGYFFPLEDRTATPLLTEAFEKNSTRLETTYYAEAASRRDHKHILAAGCSFAEAIQSEQGTRPCLEKGKWFIAMNYGNPRISLEEGIAFARKGLLIGLGVLVAIAALIMWTTIGKVMADSRRETAVFRALGARRSDIMAIYLLYALMLAAIAYALALALGGAGAAFTSSKVGPMLTGQVVETFGAYERQDPILLFGLDPRYLLGLLGLVALAAVIGALLPLALNSARNPLKGMRDE